MSGAKASKVTPSSADPTIKKYRLEYAKADQFCQQVQDFVSEAGIPAMNELRNAGHHLLRAQDDNGKIIKRDELIRAINHTKRACYEAGEAGILVALDHIRIFKDDFRMVPLTNVLPDFLDMMQNAEKARVAMLDARTDDDDRTNDYQLRMDSFTTLKEICERLDVARPEAVKLMNEAQRTSRRFVVQISVAAIVALIAIFTFLIKIFSPE